MLILLFFKHLDKYLSRYLLYIQYRSIPIHLFFQLLISICKAHHKFSHNFDCYMLKSKNIPILLLSQLFFHMQLNLHKLVYMNHLSMNYKTIPIHQSFRQLFQTFHNHCRNLKKIHGLNLYKTIPIHRMHFFCIGVCL